jgi:hypothetical protein
MYEVETLKNWIAEQNDSPRLHINGNDHPTALITVDFGQPISGIQLSNDRGNELSALLKAAAKSVNRRRGNVRVNFDHHHGVMWASVSA